MQSSRKRATLIIDGIIFGLQQAGGISRVWSTLIPEFLAQGVEFRYVEPTLANENIYRASLDLPAAQKESLRKFSKFTHQTLIDEAGIYVPTYYRPASKKQRSIQVCHDTIREESISKLLLPPLKARRRYLYDRAERIICVSNATREDLLRHYGEPIYRKAVVIPNPLDSTKMASMAAVGTEAPFKEVPAELPIALYIGKRDGAKNFSECLTLLSQTVASGLCLAVVGAPFSEDEERLLASYRTRVFNLGRLSDNALAEAMAAASFLFLPSKKEGFGFPTVEALSLGTPVVCTDTPINREVALELANFYPTGSAEALLAAVNAALGRGRLSGDETRRIRDAYDSRQIATRYLACFNELA
jgi:glycosyltransferase involved in cell wall biosynthesis